MSGTFTLANGYGQSYDEDALYCYGDSGFDTPQCTPTPQRFGDFFIGSGSSSLQNIDAYQAPGGGGTPLGYSISHTYIVDFYPPADGPLTAGGYLAKYGCNGCTTSISGTITIEIYGPSAPPPSPPPPPSGASFTFPTVFCAGTASDLTGQTAPLARRLCATRKLVTFQEHEQAQRDLRQLVYVAAYSCGYALSGRTGSDEAFITAFAICNLAIQEIVKTYRIVQAPVLAGSEVPPAIRASVPCPASLSASQCAALNAALSNYRKAGSYAANASGDFADEANTVSQAVQANSPLRAFFHQSLAKVYEGVLAADLAAEQADGRTLAGLIQSDHLGGRLSWSARPATRSPRIARFPSRSAT